MKTECKKIVVDWIAAYCSNCSSSGKHDCKACRVKNMVKTFELVA